MSELTELEKQLEREIKRRNEFKPVYINPYESSLPTTPIDPKQYEYLKSWHDITHIRIPNSIPNNDNSDNNMVSYMMVSEHGKPYQSNKLDLLTKANNMSMNSMTFMLAAEHGQPYKKSSVSKVKRAHGYPWHWF